VLDKAGSYDELVRKLKESHCPKCELNLFCASGRSGGDSFWCNNCSGYYVPDLKRLVHCSGFPAKRAQYRWRMGHSDSSMVRGWRTRAGEPRCPICATRNEPWWHPAIHGFVAEEHR
jgi:hypothetical protein